MEENKQQQFCYPVDKALEDLSDAMRFNRSLPEEVADTTATLCEVKGEREIVFVRGSAHMMRDRFIALFKARPELRIVVDSVLRDMYQIENR